MYHLLKAQQKPRIYQGIYYRLSEKQEPVQGATQKPEPEAETTQQEPVTERGATQEPEPEATQEAEPVYTVIGEPVFPTEDPGVITLVLDPHPAPSEHQQDEEPEEDPWPTTLAPRRHFAPFGWSLVGVVLALGGVLAVMLVLPWLETSATVTIVPLTHTVNTTFAAQLVPAHADPAHQQIQGRPLATLTIRQGKIVPTTGIGYQLAQAAQGWMTLYNALPIAQTVPVGTLIIGQDGGSVTTDGTVTIPAANAPIEGQASVSAHATEPGPAGNIAALDINGPCCRANITAKNPVAFTGGQNTKRFQAVSTQDIKGAATTLETSLTQDATAVYQAELQNGESLITPVSCRAQINADHSQGNEAEKVTVSVSETCQGITYNATQMQTLVTQAISQQMQGSQAGGYQLDSRSLHIQVAPSSTHTGDMQVQAHGTLLYQWSQPQQHAFAVLIAGKSKAQATILLERQPGISTVAITQTGRSAGTLPNDPGRIQFVVAVYEQ